MSQPCYNGATCVSTTTGNLYACECAAGYAGVNCEEDVNECDSSPCVRGTCVNDIGRYVCACPQGWQGVNCQTDTDECTSSPCHADAICRNSPGSYSCECKPGFYGDGLNCTEIVTFSTANATKLTESDFNYYGVSEARIETEIPFAIGDRESLICRISKDGYISFSDPPYQLSYPTWYRYLVKPMVYPYWSYRYSFAYNDSAVYYELLDGDTHRNTDNWQKTKEVISDFSSGTFEPLSALVVTWHRLRPYSYYHWCCHYCNYYYHRLRYSWALYYCRRCDPRQEHITFQAVVARNESHSFAIFNFGQFDLHPWRWGYYYVASGFTDGYETQQQLMFSYYWYRSSRMADSLRMGNSGKRGRHVLLLAANIQPSNKLKCKQWLREQRQRPLQVATECSSCPRDMRQAVLDWRYSPYEYSCDKHNANSKGSYTISMCFRGRYRCVQNFQSYSCRWSWNWWCSWYRCQFYQAPRCCYKLRVHWKKDGVLQDYCDQGYSPWTMRWLMRNVMFDRRKSGWLVRSTINGAGHAMVLERQRHGYWFGDYSQQLRSETFGYDICRAARMPGRYRKLRRKCSSATYTEPVWGWNRGDPHITTVDGRTYTFNGLCEYHLLRNSSSEQQLLQLQARTALAKPSSPNATSRATVFSGFALKAGSNNASVAVLYNVTADDIDVFVDSNLLGSVMEVLSKEDNATLVENYSIQASDNSSVTVTDSDTGFSITVSKSLGFLQASLQMDEEKHGGAVEGLMGNFNGNSSDDFRMRNGTLLPADSSERSLFEFGQSWRLADTDESLFPYLAGQSRDSFCNLSFVPVFVEDFKDNLLELFSNNSELMTSANSTCWHSNELVYLSCMYDAAQLQSLSAAQAASLAVSQEAAAKAVASNTAPQFHMPSAITVFASSTFNVSLNVSDKNGDAISLSLQDPSDSSVQLVDGNLVWSVGNFSNATSLSVVATDSQGAPTEWKPVLLYCHCLNGGNCSFGYANSTTAVGESFYFAECSCPPGYQGDRCEVTPCDAEPSPCYNRSMCHMHSNGSFYCDPCPDGMVGDGTVCDDTDECLEQPGICQEVCTNQVPGYECSCSTAGFKVSPSNRSRCEDVDECLEGGHDCRADDNQTCVNTIGSFECRCPSGWWRNALKLCQDVDECAAAANPCGSAICVNKPGTFECGCVPGQLKLSGVCKTVRIADSSTVASAGNNQGGGGSLGIYIGAAVGGAALIAAAIAAAVLLLRSRKPVTGLVETPDCAEASASSEDLAEAPASSDD